MKMFNLQRLEQSLQNYLLSHKNEIADQIVCPPHEDTVSARLAIYGEGYELRLQEALQEDYAGLYAWLGEERFNQVTADYIRTCPSQVYSLSEYGAGLEQFLLTHPDYQADEAMVEMVRFEWTLSKAQLAPDGIPMTSKRLAEVPLEQWESMCFSFHPSLNLIRLKTNIPQIWLAATAGKSVPDLEINMEAVLWAVWRRHVEIYFSVYDTVEAQVMQALVDGNSLEQACEKLRLDEAQGSQFIAELLQRLLFEEQLVAVQVKPKAVNVE